MSTLINSRAASKTKLYLPSKKEWEALTEEFNRLSLTTKYRRRPAIKAGMDATYNLRLPFLHIAYALSHNFSYADIISYAEKGNLKDAGLEDDKHAFTLKPSL